MLERFSCISFIFKPHWFCSIVGDFSGGYSQTDSNFNFNFNFNVAVDQKGLEKQEIQLNLCITFSILIFSELHVFA